MGRLLMIASLTTLALSLTGCSGESTTPAVRAPNQGPSGKELEIQQQGSTQPTPFGGNAKATK